MAERLVVNTGPLIALQRAAALDVVGRLPFEFLSPMEVRDELLEGVRHGHAPVSSPWEINSRSGQGLDRARSQFFPLCGVELSAFA